MTYGTSGTSGAKPMVGDRGPECGYYNRHPELVRRFEAEETVAKRDGCGEVKDFKALRRGEGDERKEYLLQLRRASNRRKRGRPRKEA